MMCGRDAARLARPNHLTLYVTIGAMSREGNSSSRILDGRAAATQIKSEVAAEVTALKREHGVTRALAAVLVGDDPASAVYVRNKIRACEEVGIASEHIPMPAIATTSELLAVVKRLNHDDDVDGILVQLPLPKQIDDATII